MEKVIGVENCIDCPFAHIKYAGIMKDSFCKIFDTDDRFELPVIGIHEKCILDCNGFNPSKVSSEINIEQKVWSILKKLTSSERQYLAEHFDKSKYHKFPTYEKCSKCGHSFERVIRKFLLKYVTICPNCSEMKIIQDIPN